MQFKYALALLRYIAFAMSVPIGGFLMSLSMAKDIKNDAYAFNKCVRTKPPKSEIFQRFCEIVRSHSVGIQLRVCEKCIN